MSLRDLINIRDCALFIFCVSSTLIFRRINSIKKKCIDDLYLIEEDFIKKNYVDTLIGNDFHIGLFDVISKKKFKSIEAIKLYMGVSLYNVKCYNEAISYLSSINVEDKLIKSKINTLIGDCYVEIENYENAIEYYNQGINLAENSSAICSNIVYKIVLIYENQNKYKEAVDLLTKTIDKFKDSKYISNLKDERKRLNIFLNT